MPATPRRCASCMLIRMIARTCPSSSRSCSPGSCPHGACDSRGPSLPDVPCPSAAPLCCQIPAALPLLYPLGGPSCCPAHRGGHQQIQPWGCCTCTCHDLSNQMSHTVHPAPRQPPCATVGDTLLEGHPSSCAAAPPMSATRFERCSVRCEGGCCRLCWRQSNSGLVLGQTRWAGEHEPESPRPAFATLVPLLAAAVGSSSPLCSQICSVLLCCCCHQRLLAPANALHLEPHEELLNVQALLLPQVHLSNIALQISHYLLSLVLCSQGVWEVLIHVCPGADCLWSQLIRHGCTLRGCKERGSTSNLGAGA